MSVLNVIKREPVRVYIYSVLVVVLGGLATLGYVTEDTLALILTVSAGVLVVPAVEVARRKVVPTAKLLQESAFEDDGEEVENPEPIVEEVPEAAEIEENPEP